VNTHNRLRYFLTNKIFLSQFMYRYVRVIFIVKCVPITRFLIACATLRWKSVIFIALSSLATVHGTVQYSYCIFSLLYRLLRIRLKSQNPVHSYVREREREGAKVHCKCTMQCTVHFILLLLPLALQSTVGFGLSNNILPFFPSVTKSLHHR
jgi:hypothetical protein